MSRKFLKKMRYFLMRLVTFQMAWNPPNPTHKVSECQSSFSCCIHQPSTDNTDIARHMLRDDDCSTLFVISVLKFSRRKKNTQSGSEKESLMH